METNEKRGRNERRKAQMNKQMNRGRKEGRKDFFVKVRSVGVDGQSVFIKCSCMRKLLVVG